MGSNADADSQSVTRVSSWLTRLSGKDLRLKKQTLKTPFARNTVSGCTFSIREPPSQRLVVLGVVGGKEVERQDMG